MQVNTSKKISDAINFALDPIKACKIMYVFQYLCNNAVFMY